MNLKHLTKDVGRVIAENSPQILTAIGVVGVAATTYLTGQATWRAAEVLEEKHRAGLPNIKHMPVKDMAKDTWKLYVPAAATGVMTVVCIVAANRVQARRMAALAAAYGILSGDFDEFRDKAAEKLGLKKTDEIDSALVKGKMGKNPPPVTPLDGSKSWFCDFSTMGYFPSTQETIKAGQNEINYRINNGDSPSLNDFYGTIGRPTTHVGDQLGWNKEHQVELTFTPILMDEGGAATAFTFVKQPFPNFWK